MISEQEIRQLLEVQERVAEVADDLARLYYASRGWKIECPDRSYGLEEIDSNDVTVVYQDRDGDRYCMTFPIQLLWDEALQQQAAVDAARQQSAQAAREQQLAEQRRRSVEAIEKAQLATLLKKHGPPAREEGER